MTILRMPYGIPCGARSYVLSRPGTVYIYIHSNPWMRILFF